jgi:hypothetical protein
VAEVVGGVKWNGSLDGDRIPAQAEKIGQEAGAAGAKGYDEKWQKGFKDTLTESGKKSYDQWTKQGRKDGTTYGKGLSERLDSYVKKAQKNFESLRLDPGFLDDFSKKFDDADLAAGDLQRQLKTLRDETNLHPAAYKAAQKQLDDWVGSQKHAESEARRLKDEADKVIPSFANLRAEMDKNRGASDRLKISWQDLSANTRQWTLIIGVIASAGDEIAALGSAAGGGILALGGAATAAIGGVGALALVFSELNKDAKKLPDDLKGAAVEFTGLKDALVGVQEQITRGAISEMSGDFTLLEGVLKQLNPQFTTLGKAAGHVFDEFTTSLSGGGDALTQVQTMIGLAATNFEQLAGSAGTFGLAMVRAINQAQPLVKGLLDYVDRLATQFNNFTQSNGFDQWMSHAQTIFGALGPLLDAVGRGLNDLVTDASVNRTAIFINNLTDFIPDLTTLLQILGDLNVFGLLAQALADVGDALSPLAPSMTALATAVSGALSDAITGAATVLGALATALAPLVQMAADFVNAIPAPVLQAIAGGLVAVAAGFVAITAVKGIATFAGSLEKIASEGIAVVEIFGQIAKSQGVAAALKGVAVELTGLDTAFTKATGSATDFGSKLGGMVGKAGLLGAFAAVGVGIGAAISGIIDKMNDWEGKANEAVAANKGLLQSYQDIFGQFANTSGVQNATDAFGNLKLNADNLHGALQRIADEDAHGGEFFAGWTIGASDLGDAAHDLRSTLGELDPALATLAGTDLSAASAQFSAYATEAGASNEQILAMINNMPGFKDALTQAANAQGLVATNANLVQLAMTGQTQAQIDAAAAAAAQADQLRVLSGQSITTSTDTDNLSQTIAGFSSTAYDARSASRDYQSALDAATQSVKNNGAALNTQKTDFDTSTAAGRANQAAMDAVGQKTLAAAAAIEKQTGDQAAASIEILKGRDALVKQLEKLGLSSKAAQDYADRLGLIPSNVNTAIHVDTKGANQAVTSFYDTWDGRIISMTVRADGQITTGQNRNQSTAHAAGTITTGPEYALIGEAGPEAVVPLDRSLSRVDPSVRWLSAIAQGKASTTAMATGGIRGAGSEVTIEAGAIVVQGAVNPAATALAVLNRAAEVLF